MELILLVVILFALFGGGSYYGFGAGWPSYGYGGVGLVGVVLILLLVFGVFGRL